MLKTEKKIINQKKDKMKALCLEENTGKDTRRL